MLYRDSSIATHFGRGVIAGADSSHGIRLEGGSTGATIDPVGDDSDISLSIAPKGAGTCRINSTKFAFGGSTTTFTGIRRVRVDFTVPALSSAGSAVHGSSIALAGLTTNAVIMMQPRVPLNSSVAGVTVQARCSTAGALHLTFSNNSLTTLSGSTMSAYALIFDMPAAV
jgi:hypothetical protein